jgi:hypothetical protein
VVVVTRFQLVSKLIRVMRLSGSITVVRLPAAS